MVARLFMSPLCLHTKGLIVGRAAQYTSTHVWPRRADAFRVRVRITRI